MLYAKHVYVVVDACYSGLLAKRGARGIMVQPRSPQYGGYLRRMCTQKARQVLAAGGQEQVQDVGPSGHSPFTHYFLKALSGAADRNLDRVVSAEEIELYVTEQVSNSYDQTPHGGRLRGDEEGDFLFAVPRK